MLKMNQTAASPLHDKDVRNAVAHIINYDSMAKLLAMAPHQVRHHSRHLPT